MRGVPTHIQGLAEIAVALKETNDLFPVRQGHATTGLEDLVKNRPKSLENLAINDASTTSVEIGPSTIAFEYVTVDVPHTDTAQDLDECGKFHARRTVKTLTEM